MIPRTVPSVLILDVLIWISMIKYSKTPAYECDPGLLTVVPALLIFSEGWDSAENISSYSSFVRSNIESILKLRTGEDRTLVQPSISASRDICPCMGFMLQDFNLLQSSPASSSWGTDSN
jgi:hypothetical protein